jgi:hypothetical protein
MLFNLISCLQSPSHVCTQHNLYGVIGIIRGNDHEVRDD